jgi:hypothetical protein
MKVCQDSPFPSDPPSYVRKGTSLFSFLASFVEHLERPTLGAKRSESKVFLCMDCVFWCGRCSEPTLKGKKSINQLASSYACPQFQPRGGSQK